MLKRIFSSSFWSIHNPLKGWTLHHLSLREAQIIVHTLSTAETQLGSAWESEWPNWKPLNANDCKVLFELKVQENKQAPPEPAMGTEEEITAVRIEKKPEAKLRGFTRIRGSFAVQVIVAQNTFDTETVDFSEGGFQLKDHLPDWVVGYFTVIIKTPERPFEVTCILVEDQKLKKNRIEVVETEDEESHLPAYRTWVLSRRDSAPAQ